MRRLPGGRHAVIGALLLAGLVGCSSSGGSGSPTAATVARHDAAAVWHELVQCARANGMPNLPDPRIDSNGLPQWPGGEPPQPPESVRRACQSIIERLPGARAEDDAPGNVPALVRFAECIREHGFPDFPDPLSDGNFDARAFPPGVKPGNPPFDAAMQACRQLNPDPNGEIHAH